MGLKYDYIIKKMSLEEKAYMMSGKNNWETVSYEEYGIPSMFMSDGPHGLRKQGGSGDHLGLGKSSPATCFPTSATIANSWDEKLGWEIGEALGKEAITLDVNVILGPGLNIKRSPLCGRNFEYFSEDPYLSGKMAAAYVKGIQSQGISACPKHFAANSQELRRMASNSVIDERTLREIYTTGFEIAIKEGKAKSIMTAYNEINGIYANENARILQDILVHEWEFDGFVVSDWGGSNDHALGVKNGSHLEMPGTGKSGMTDIIKGIEDGVLEEATLDQRLDELLDVVFATHEATKKANKTEFDVEKHHELARRAAEESIVLLKNENNILPLKEGTKVAIIGDFAKTPRYQGAGSSLVNPTKTPESIFDVIDDSGLEMISYEKGYVRNRKTNKKLLKDAVESAIAADVVLICAGLDEISESEGMDRNHMRMPDAQNELIEAVGKVNENVIVILSAGSAIEMHWIDSVKGVVHGYLGGQAGASAMMNVISGRVCPSGKLNESYPFKYEDTPACLYFPSKERTTEYRESLYVGYRYYSTVFKDVLFPFGYGLSYTTFEYSNFKIEDDRVTFTLKNTGNYDGAEVVQLYVGRDSESVFCPAKELKGFDKVYLQIGQEKEVSIYFDDKTFRFYDVRTDTWEVETGLYSIYVGSNVEDVRLSGVLNVEGTVKSGPYSQETLPSYFDGSVKNVDDKEYEVLYGRELPDGNWSGEIGLNDAFCQLYYSKGIIARLFYWIMTKLKQFSEWRGKPSLNILFIYNMPILGFAKFSKGLITMDMARAMVDLANGKRIKGTKKFFKALIKKFES